VRAQFPSGTGLWPAIWLVTPPDRLLSGEIDIVEGFGSRPDIIQSTLHPWIAAHENSQECVLLYLQGEIDRSFHPHSPCARIPLRAGLANTDTTRFHEYKVVWSPKRVTWYFDGVSYYSTTSNVPQMPMNLVINLGVSVKNQWDGAPDESTGLPKDVVVESVSIKTPR
jgi:beta-glucanase (GH16 family)